MPYHPNSYDKRISELYIIAKMYNRNCIVSSGTWMAEESTKFKTGGIFKYIRHPHYTSLLIIGFGLSIFFYSLLAFAIAIIAIPIMICSIFDEEKLLKKQYGEDYIKYMKNVPWRLIPRIF